MRIASIVHATFAATMIGLGIIGLFRPDFVPVWNPVPTTVPAREVLLRLAAFTSLTCGICLLIQRVAIIGARWLLATFLLWLTLLRLPNFLHEPAFEACWSVFPLAVMLAAAWVRYVSLGADWDCTNLSLVTGNNGLRIARMLYGLSLIFFGMAHFIDLKDTLALIPNWLPGHLFWAYFTGCTFVAAGVAVLSALYAWVAATLSALQISLFLVLVWIPILASGSKDSFQWSEAILTAALAAGAWVVAESYRGTPRLAVNNRFAQAGMPS